MPSRWHLAISGDTFGCHNWGKGELYWHLVNRRQRCGSISLKAQDSPSQERIISNIKCHSAEVENLDKSVIMRQVSLSLSLYIWEECNLKKCYKPRRNQARIQIREPESKSSTVIDKLIPTNRSHQHSIV